MNTISETRLEQACKKIVIANGGFYWKFVSPSFTGVPDRICLFPNGIIVFVEWKRPGRLDGLSEKQKKAARLLKQRGFNVLVVDDADVFSRCIEEIIG